MTSRSQAAGLVAKFTRRARRRVFRCCRNRGDGPSGWTAWRRPAHHPCEGVQKAKKLLLPPAAPARVSMPHAVSAAPIST
jgi:hypothetical protein